MAGMSRVDERMERRIDPGIAAAQRALAGRVTPLDPVTQSPAEMRWLAEAAGALWADGMPVVAHLDTFEMPCPSGPLRARWLDPRTPEGEAGGAIMFLHGGGWSIGSVDTHDRLMRCLAVETGRPVLGIDYRLAPEHPFPAALSDSLGAFAWLVDNADRCNIDPERIAMCGDSSGANLALAVAIERRDGFGPRPRALALFYPCLSPDTSTQSHREFGDGRYGLTTERTAHYWRSYLGESMRDAPPLAAPLRAALAGLPPSYVCLAELDPLADEARQLADRLAAAGVPCALDEWRGAVHGFMQMTRDVPLAREAVTAAAAFIRKHV